MIRDLFEEIFSPYLSWGDRILAGFVALVFLVVAGLLGLLVLVLVDEVGVKPTNTTMTVIELKYIIPAHNTTTFVLIGKVPVPITTHHPESYHINFKIEAENQDVAIEKKFFDSCRTGDRIEVDYGRGRISGSYKPVTIR